MMVRVGNFLFRYRNALFPVIYILLLFNSRPLMPDYGVAALIGFIVAAFGQSFRAVTIGLEYIIRGGRKRRVYAEKLVQGGIFAHCRNPLYVGNFVIIVGVAIASNSLSFILVAIPFFAFSYWAIIAAEENYLQSKFGQEFDDYCARVNRFVPNGSGISQTLSGMRFNWRRLLTAEYGSAYIWMAAIIFVTLKNLWMSGDYETSRALAGTLWILLALVTLAYVFARFLKKSRLVKE
jgi:protein-S-isoprenylcysteine O-methyltransferase Ste14